MTSKLPVQKAVSAGGVVYKFDGDNLKILICGRRDGNVWGLPKGTPEQGETLEETAAREVNEETGLKGKLQDKIGEINYWFSRNGTRYNKTVHFYLFSPTGGSIEDHDPEFDFVAWFPWDEAIKKLTYRDEIDMVNKALNIMRTKYAPGQENPYQVKR